MPKISILIPVYNTENYIARCLESILNQDFVDFEVIVVNDATQDNAMQIVKEYAQKDSRIIIIDKKLNEGSMAARKTGYQNAKGDYIVFCDSDDYYLPGSLKKLYEKIEECQSDVVVSGYRYVPTSQSPYDKVSVLPFGNSSIDVFKALLNGSLTHNLVGNIYKRSIFDNYNYYCLKNATRAEDMSLFYEIIRNITSVYALGEVTYAYCQNRESSSFGYISEEIADKMLLLLDYWYEKSLNRYPELESDIKEAYLKILLRHNIRGNATSVIKVLKNHHDLLQNSTRRKFLGGKKALVFNITKRLPLPTVIRRIILKYLPI